MNRIQYSIPLWVFDTGRLTLYAICTTYCTEVEFELASIVVYYILTMWGMVQANVGQKLLKRNKIKSLINVQS